MLRTLSGNEMIDSMIAKIDQELQRVPADGTNARYILGGVHHETLEKVKKFLLSFKQYEQPLPGRITPEHDTGYGYTLPTVKEIFDDTDHHS